MTEQKPEETNNGGKDAKSYESSAPAVLRVGDTPESRPAQESQQNTARNLAQQIRHTDHMIAWSTSITAILTLVLAALAVLQAYSFIESERAFLVITTVNFLRGDPTADSDGFDFVLTIKNFGKHTAAVKSLTVLPNLYVIKKELPETPNYNKIGSIKRTLPPLPPDTPATFAEHMPALPSSDALTIADILKGVLSGDYPARIFGLIEYDIGFPWPRPGQTGFCYEYIPKKERVSPATFQTCNGDKYTFTR
jgi:hypothetical protein